MVAAVVGARLRRRHALALPAEERVLELQRADAELLLVETVEHLLRLVGSVVVADAGVVTAHDEVGDAIVLPKKRVPDRLTRPPVAHRRREHRQDHAVVRVVVLHQDLVALHPDLGGDVVALGATHQRVDQQSVDAFQRNLRQVLVRPMDRVTGLESNERLPAPLRDLLADL